MRFSKRIHSWCFPKDSDCEALQSKRMGNNDVNEEENYDNDNDENGERNGEENEEVKRKEEEDK